MSQHISDYLQKYPVVSQHKKTLQPGGRINLPNTKCYTPFFSLDTIYARLDFAGMPPLSYRYILVLPEPFQTLWKPSETVTGDLEELLLTQWELKITTREGSSKGRTNYLNVPLRLRRLSGLNDNVILTGMGNMFGIWNQSEWKYYSNPLSNARESIMARHGF